MIKQCNDSFDYGCKRKIEYENEDELSKLFYKKGEWYRNTCKHCDRKRTNELYKTGKYNFHIKNKTIIDNGDYGTFQTITEKDFYVN